MSNIGIMHDLVDDMIDRGPMLLDQGGVCFLVSTQRLSDQLYFFFPHNILLYKYE